MTLPYVETHGFGSGILWGIPSGSNPTPVRFGVLQDVSVDFTFSVKELFGMFQFPVDIGRGTAKITGSATTGAIQKDLFSRLFFNDTPGTGQGLRAVDEPGSVPATSTYTVTVTHSADYVDDLGVRYAATGQPMTRVSSSPAAGQYSVSAGVYTFASDDASAAVLLSYRYASTDGFKTVISNNLLGDAPTFGIDLYQRSQKAQTTQQWSMRLYRCMSSKLTLATKLEDFVLPAFSFEAFADDSNNIGEINTPN
jgi:hypothetical protein